MRRGRLVLWAFLMVLMLVAAACQQSGDDGGDTGGDKVAACSSEKLETASLGSFAGVSRGPLLAQAKKKLVIAAFGDRTGANSQLIVPSHNGAALAIKQANAKGDLPVELELRAIDNKDANKDTAAPIAQSVIGDASVIATIGGGFSGETGAVGQLFSDAGMLLISPSATRVDLVAQGWKTFFRGLGDDDSQGKAVVPLFESLGCKNIAVVNDKTAYGQGLAQVVSPAAKAAGLEVVLDEGIEPTTDYTALVDSILAKDPEAVFYAGYASEFQLVARQLREKGYEGLIASGDGSKTASIAKDIGAEHADGVVLLCPCADPNVSTDPASQKFVKDFKADFSAEPSIYAAEGYDVANITINAIRECGKGGASGVTRACVVEQVRKTNYKGLTKTFEFEANGQVKEQSVVVYLIKSGKITEIGPISKLAG